MTKKKRRILAQTMKSCVPKIENKIVIKKYLFFHMQNVLQDQKMSSFDQKNDILNTNISLFIQGMSIFATSS